MIKIQYDGKSKFIQRICERLNVKLEESDYILLHNDVEITHNSVSLMHNKEV